MVTFNLTRTVEAVSAGDCAAPKKPLSSTVTFTVTAPAYAPSGTYTTDCVVNSAVRSAAPPLKCSVGRNE